MIQKNLFDAKGDTFKMLNNLISFFAQIINTTGCYSIGLYQCYAKPGDI